MFSFVVVTLFSLTMSSAAPSLHSGHLQHISVPDYNPKLEFLGQHVDLPEIPTKVVRITKTVAIKVPVPYPVNVPHHVPYPVQINKPYPVPVTKIVKIPEPVPVSIHSGGGGASHGASLQFGHGGSAGQDYSSESYGGGYGADQNSHGYDGDFGGHGAVQGYQGYDNGGGYGGQGYSGDVGEGHGYSGAESYGESNQVFTPAAYSGNVGSITHGQMIEPSAQHSSPGEIASYYQGYQGQQAAHYGHS